MKLQHTLPLVALACIATSASATVTDWGPLGPTPSVAFVKTAAGPVDDIFTFTISASSNVDAYGEEFEARSVSLSNASFSLFSGVYGSGSVAQIGQSFAFNNTPSENMFTSLAAGTYYFEVTGTATKAGAAYDFEAYANNANPPSAVPEPADAALLIAGLGMLGFVGRRRQR